MMLRIGFIGLGKMGLPMVGNLARNENLSVLAFDRSEAALGSLQAHPAWGTRLRAATALADFADCEVVVTMLPDSTATNAVLSGEGGLAGLLAPGAVVVDMGSSDPAATLALGRELGARGIALVDAPVSGSVAKAEAASLSIMAGGLEGALGERVLPVLHSMGKTIIATGALGSAHAIKTLNNYIYAAGLLAVSEAAMIGKAMGLDLEVLADVVNASSGRNVASETKLKQFILNGAYSGGFALRLQAKDLRTAASLQGLTGREAPQLALCNALWGEAVAALPESADNTEIHRFLAARAAITEEE